MSSWASTHRRISSSGQAPVVGEAVDVGRHDEQRVVGAGDRQVVLAERARGHPADHRADGHAHHRRGHHRAEVGHHRHHRVAAVASASSACRFAAGQRRTLPSDVASSVNSGR